MNRKGLDYVWGEDPFDRTLREVLILGYLWVGS